MITIRKAVRNGTLFTVENTANSNWNRTQNRLLNRPALNSNELPTRDRLTDGILNEV